MKRNSKRALDRVVTVLGVIAALAAFYILLCAFLVLVRDSKPMTREAAVRQEEAGPAEEITGTEPGPVRDIGCAALEVDFILDVPLNNEFQIYLHGLCADAGVPYTLAVAVIEAESGYRAAALSPTGDWGLMQINDTCHAWLSAELGITDFLDPYQNARAGVYILGMYYRQYGADSGTLMAYNLGQPAAEALFAQGIYETEYSRRVMGIRWRIENGGAEW